MQFGLYHLPEGGPLKPGVKSLRIPAICIRPFLLIDCTDEDFHYRSDSNDEYLWILSFSSI